MFPFLRTLSNLARLLGFRSYKIYKISSNHFLKSPACCLLLTEKMLEIKTREAITWEEKPFKGKKMKP